MVKNIAHRGFSGMYPENTEIAFLKAAEVSCCDGFETDVQMTKDEVIVICHDERIDRTSNGTGFIKDYSYEELLRFDFGQGQRIMRIEHLLEMVSKNQLLLNIELKNTRFAYEGMEEIIIRQIYAYNMQNQVIFSSFNHLSMKKCKEIAPNIQTGLLYEQPLYKAEAYARTVGANAIHPDYETVFGEKSLVRRAKEAGVQVNVWTINEIEDMKKAIRLGVDAIITNYPDRLSGLISS